MTGGEWTPWEIWLAIALILAIAEIVMPGIFLIWIALGAAITGIAIYFVPLALPLQIVLFAGLCLLATYVGRRWYKDDPGDSEDPLLNDRTARLVGQIVTVSQAIEAGRGRVKVGDSQWQCKGIDSPAGAQVRIVGAEGSLLLVEGL